MWYGSRSFVEEGGVGDFDEEGWNEAIDWETYTPNPTGIPRGTVRSPSNTPTHTDDGILIRKLYVSNLPPKTTRSELFQFFAQFGFLKSCWIKKDENNLYSKPHSYAFVTFIYPRDAQKALKLSQNERVLRGCMLNISPADSWHQPSGQNWTKNWVKTYPTHLPRNEWAFNVNAGYNWPTTNNSCTKYKKPWNTNRTSQAFMIDTSRGESSHFKTANTVNNTATNTENNCDDYNILDYLNRDCLIILFSYVPVLDLIKTERVSKRWRSTVLDYLGADVRLFKSSRWDHLHIPLSTTVLRWVLMRIGPSLVRLHLDHRFCSLNERTAHVIAKYCPQLQELKVLGNVTNNWNPVIYNCKYLNAVFFLSCDKMTDKNIAPLLRSNSCVTKITLTNNTHMLGTFFSDCRNDQLTHLSLRKCYSLNTKMLESSAHHLRNLTTLIMDSCPMTIWSVLPSMLKKMPKLEHLSLNEYLYSMTGLYTTRNLDELCTALATLTKLKVLNVSRNAYIDNAFIKQVAKTCTKLESLNVAGCNATGSYMQSGVGDSAIAAVCASNRYTLRHLDVSYLAGLTDAGVRATAACGQLRVLVSRGVAALTPESFLHTVQHCTLLEELDVCGCDCVTPDIVSETCHLLDQHPRLLKMWLGGTPAAEDKDLPQHKYLMVNVTEARCIAPMRPDYMNDPDDYSDESYEFDDDRNFYDSDEDIYQEDMFDMPEALYEIQLIGNDINNLYYINVGL